MKKCVVASDSFKGTLSSVEICSIASETIPLYFPGCQVAAIPVADGGEGTVDCLLRAMDAEPVSVSVSGAYGEPRAAVYARRGGDAVIECASAAGLPSVGERRDPSLTSTYGVGQLMLHAAEAGCRHIYLGLGGSATNDGGCGCAAALGVRFTDGQGRSFVPVGGTLRAIRGIDASKAARALEGVDITVMSDVRNPLYGENGAAYVFAPQKGAGPEMVEELDAGLRHLSRVISSELGLDVSELPGGGAAGGFGAGAAAFLGGSIRSGIQVVLQLTDFDRRLEGAELVITGEGRLDSQSLSGKVISGVAARAAAAGIPAVAIVGCVGGGAEGIYSRGVAAVLTANRAGLPPELLAPRAAADYRAALEDLLRLLKLGAALPPR